jgi:hypothetical protein
MIERKLAAGEIGLLHEVFLNGKWRTLRDYLAEKEADRQAALHAQEEADRLAREEEERALREQQELRRAATLAEEKRKNDLMEEALSQQREQAARPSRTALMPLRLHRGETILAFGLIGLLVCFPFCIAAWSMGSSDLEQMDLGVMDPSGRSLTSSGRTIGVIGTILWCVGLLFYALVGASGL